MEMIDSVAFPRERLPFLRGKKQATQLLIEKKTGASLTIAEGVTIAGEPEAVLRATTIVKAIARGFSPKEALLLVDEEYQLAIISLRAETKNTQQRLFGRVIGRHGQAKERIEKACSCRIALYGKTVSIIAPETELARAERAVELLLEGREHSYVWKRMGKKTLL